MTLKEIIKGLMARSTKAIWCGGVVEYTFSGKVDPRLVEAIWNAYRNGQLDSAENSVFYASKDSCSVSFRLGRGASTQTWVAFTYTDERALAIA